MPLKAISNHVIFVFEDSFKKKTVDNNRQEKLFVEKTDWGFETISPEDSMKTPRWGISIATGPRCSDDIKPGMRILIEPLKWTNGVQVGEDWFWRTNDESIIMIDEEFTVEKSKATA